MRTISQAKRGVTARWQIGIRAITCLMLCATLAATATAWAEDAAEEPVPVVEAPPPTAIPPTPVPPTPTPVSPTPTPVPPTPTPTPPPATEEPATVPSTDIPATEPAGVGEEATPTETPSPTPTPIPLAVDCAEPIEGEPVFAEEVVEFECLFAGGPFTPVMVYMPPGWEYSFDGKEETYSDELRIKSHIVDAETGKLKVYLRATDDAQPGGAEFDVEFRAESAVPGAPALEITLKATLELPSTPTATPSSTPVLPSVDCDRLNEIETVAVGVIVEYRCAFTGGPITPVMTTIPVGWEYSFDGAQASYASEPGSDATRDGETGIFSVYLRAGENAEPGEAIFVLEFQMGDESAGSSAVQVSLIATLEANPDPTVPDLQLLCNTESLVVKVGSESAVECSITSTSESPVTISSISIPLVSGWAISTGDSALEDGSVTWYPAAHISSELPYYFSFTLSPSCSTSTEGTALAINSTFENDGIRGDGPSLLLTLARSDETSVTTSITESDLGLTAGFSFHSQQAVSSMTYQVTTTGCASWSVQVSATDYIYSGPVAGASNIPASNIALVSSDVVAVEGAEDGIQATQSGALGGPLQVLAAKYGNGPGTWEQTLNLVTTIPGNAPVGSYATVLTISIVAAP